MTNDTLSLVERLDDRAKTISLTWGLAPERTLDGQAASHIERLEAERDEARQIVADCNNSLFGSQGYFTSASGKTAASAIEDLKSAYGEQWRRAQSAEANLSVARGALERSERLLSPMSAIACTDAERLAMVADEIRQALSLTAGGDDLNPPSQETTP